MKEFTLNNLLFEGEYLNGKKWNGKFYDFDGNLISEIENGNGQGEEHNDLGYVIFKGEYLNGMWWNGEYNIYNDNDNNLTFSCQILNGIRNGYIIYDNYIKIRYEGEYLNGIKNGKAKEYILISGFSFNLIIIRMFLLAKKNYYLKENI